MADVPMTRAEAVRLIEAHEHVVRRWSGAHHDKIEEAIDAQVQSRKALIDALTRPAPQPSEGDTALIDAFQRAIENAIIKRGGVTSTTMDAQRAVMDTRTALLARLAARRVPEWRTIDTAPKDGSRVLCWTDEWSVEKGGWGVPESGCLYGTRWAANSLAADKGGWKHQPTHWQPLPAAPAPEVKPA